MIDARQPLEGTFKISWAYPDWDNARCSLPTPNCARSAHLSGQSLRLPCDSCRGGVAGSAFPLDDFFLFRAHLCRSRRDCHARTGREGKVEVVERPGCYDQIRIGSPNSEQISLTRMS